MACGNAQGHDVDASEMRFIRAWLEGQIHALCPHSYCTYINLISQDTYKPYGRYGESLNFPSLVMTFLAFIKRQREAWGKLYLTTCSLALASLDKVG